MSAEQAATTTAPAPEVGDKRKADEADEVVDKK